SFAALLVWVGRFAFLGLFLIFLVKVYRTLYLVHAVGAADVGRSHAPGPPAGAVGAKKPSGRLIVEKLDPGSEVYLEERDGKERRLREGSQIPVDAPLTVGRSRENALRGLDSFVSARHCIVHPGPDGF